MSFVKLKERLEQEGWYVGWALPCCQSCAWMEVPDDADLQKVLFNHEQDCEIDDYDFDDETDEIVINELLEGREWDTYPHYDATEVNSSMFCFSGDKEGVENLTEILPIIEECGCHYNWDGTGKSRIEISW